MPKTDLYFQKPLMNSAGTLGFSPDPKDKVDFTSFGAFVTNPVSWSARTPAKGTRYISFSGGFLIHTGYPNPGIKAILRGHARRWTRSPLPVIVHLLAQDVATMGRMVQQLEGLEGLMGIELGLPPGVDPDLAHDMALAAVGELALIVRIPFEQIPASGADWPLLDALHQAGTNAISLAPPRGLLPDHQGSLVSGRLYGSAFFPQSLSAVNRLAEADIPIIASGGVYTQEDITAMLTAGAAAVQIDVALWRDGYFSLQGD